MAEGNAAVHDESGTLTEAEAEVYDRQIRVWGVDAQKRMSKSRILAAGCTGVMAEVVKNLALAGVASLTLMDDRPASCDASPSNFFVLPTGTQGAGHPHGAAATMGAACVPGVQELNPMVRVSAATGQPEDLDASTLAANYDAVMLARAPAPVRKRVAATCRAASVSFYYVDCRGEGGYFFNDLGGGKHGYVLKLGSDDNARQEKREANYCSYQDMLAVPWASLPQKRHKVCPMFYSMRVVEEWETSHNRAPGDISPSDLPSLSAMRDSLAAAQGLEPGVAPDSVLAEIAAAGVAEMPAVNAIIGGVMAQDVLKAVSGMGEPINNHFFFSVENGSGIIEGIFPKP
eukprot:jgi/Mesvir1/9043/Mv21326-RA.1